MLSVKMNNLSFYQKQADTKCIGKEVSEVMDIYQYRSYFKSLICKIFHNDLNGQKPTPIKNNAV